MTHALHFTVPLGIVSSMGVLQSRIPHLWWQRAWYTIRLFTGHRVFTINLELWQSTNYAPLAIRRIEYGYRLRDAAKYSAPTQGKYW